MKNVIITLTIFLSFWKSTAQLEYQNDKVLGELGTGLVQQIDANKKNHFYIDKECKIESTKQKTIPLLNQTRLQYQVLHLY